MKISENYIVDVYTAHNLDHCTITLLPHILPDTIPRYYPPKTTSDLPTYSKSDSPSPMPRIIISLKPLFATNMIPNRYPADVLSAPTSSTPTNYHGKNPSLVLTVNPSLEPSHIPTSGPVFQTINLTLSDPDSELSLTNPS